MIQPTKGRRRPPVIKARSQPTLGDPTKPPTSEGDPLKRRMQGVIPHGNTPFDVPAISEIVPNLWQGGTLNGLIMPRFITHVVTLFTDQKYTFEQDVTSILTYKLEDKEYQDLSQIDTLARWINECRRAGTVLVHCSAGLNRSSVVVARALMLEGMTAQEAIDTIRSQRSPACLCNKAFEAYLLNLPL